MTPLDELRATVHEAAAALADGGPASAPTLERPKRADFGDYSTNAAMVLAPVLKAPPRDVAARLSEELRDRLAGQLERVEVAGPGFLNLFLGDEWFRDALRAVLAAGPAFGGGGAARPERIDVEFVSANPTGPMHVGHARNAAYGDALARLLAFHGHDVTREFYVNDHGTQVRKLGESIRARARGEEVPEDGYRGDYVADLAREIEGAAGLDVEALARRGVELMVAHMRESLHRFRVDFDVWFSERDLHVSHPPDPDPVRHAFAVLEEQGQVYRSEGALWLRTSELGDDKDRVLERSSGEHTYFASDIAYLQNKRERGFDRLVYTLGADHHGYVQRMKAAFQALGGDPERLELLIMQFVHLAGGQSMSKRAGEFVTLDDLVEEIGVDAARWFLLARSHDTTIELDLDLAREQSAENPVYYVQYAHARIAGVLAKAGTREADFGEVAAPLDPAERALVKKLLAWPAEVAEAAERHAPHRVTTYALELAQEFTAFYRDCRVVGAEGEGVERWRIALCVAAQRTIAAALDQLGVSAPETM
ncbi:MAG TPA: arginine--tRNA ligase [Solirubrobacteraceae bacterium]